MTQWYWGRFPPSTSVFSANFPSAKCSILVICNSHNVPGVPNGRSLTPRNLTKEKDKLEKWDGEEVWTRFI
jgi:hypothetical protein